MTAPVSSEAPVSKLRGKTDSVEHAHYVWKAGSRLFRTLLRVI
jgi:hypothetical protein